MTKMKWRFKRVLRKRYSRHIWIVAKRDGTQGYFKTPVSPNKKAYRILVANEYIAASLARSVGLPVAKTRVTIVKGPGVGKKRGIVSEKAKAKRIVTWKHAFGKMANRIEAHVDLVDLLSQVIVFDAWILNWDRTDRNLILYRNRPGETYKWYLIDHGLALFGSPEKWKRRWARKPYKNSRSYEVALHPRKSRKSISQRVPAGFKRLVLKKRAQVDEMVRVIQQLPAHEIERAIKKVPPGYLTKSERSFIKHMLLTRQKELHRIVSRLLEKFQRKIENKK